MNDLITFLLKQIARDEQTARAMSHAIEHLESRWSPARLIADCDAKRSIVDIHSGIHSCGVLDYDDGHPCSTLRHLALPYGHLAGYREEWKP